MATKKKTAAKAMAVQAADNENAAKTWKNGEVITADALNALEQRAANALSLAQTNEGDIAALETGATHSMVADTQAATLVDTFAGLALGLIPVWHAGSVVRLRSGIVDISATAGALTFRAATMFATGLALQANKSYSVYILKNDGAVEHNTLATNATGKSISFTAEWTLAAGTTALMFIVENDI